MTTPKVNSEGQKELAKTAEQFEAFDEKVKSMTLDRMNKAPLEDFEPQTKMSTREQNKADALYIKPIRSINSRERFDEKQRAAHTEAWRYVKCIVENYEIIGEPIEVWTKKFPGDSYHFWKVPVNKPIYIPKLLAEQLSQCRYHRLTMEPSSNQVSNVDQMGTYVGTVVVDSVKQRIDCKPTGFSFVSMSS